MPLRRHSAIPIAHFRAEIKATGYKEDKIWDTEAQIKIMENKWVKRKRLIGEMIAAERERCQSSDYLRLLEELMLNSRFLGSGTRARYEADRKKAENILAS